MVYNCFIKCQVCGKITRIRLQVGWLKEHPIVVSCGECGVSLSGRFTAGARFGEEELCFGNADIVQSANADYVVECSGEFPVMKRSCVKSENDSITPFLRAMSGIGSEERYEEFCENVGLLIETKGNWDVYKRILDLSDDLDSKYLVQELSKVFDEEMLPCKSKLEVLRAVRMVEVHAFIQSLRPDILTNCEFGSGILKMDYDQCGQLIDFLNNNKGFSLDDLVALEHRIMDAFVDVFPALIPAIATGYYENGYVDYERMGSTTSSFDDVKGFYIDAYEVLGDMLIVPVALNNIKYRNNFNDMGKSEGRISSLETFINASKGNRYKYCAETEVYTEKLQIPSLSKIRNGIGHNSIEYDVATQKITYQPNFRKKHISATMYLLEFENEALGVFKGILMVSEYLYRLKQIEIMMENDT